MIPGAAFDLDILRNPHVEVPLYHAMGPVLVHPGRVLLILPLVDKAQVASEAPLIVLYSHYISTSPEMNFILSDYC